jgi:hypothetical protein
VLVVIGGSRPEWFVVANGGVGGWGWQCVEESFYIYIYIYMFLVVWSLSVSLVFTIEGLVRLKNIERLFYSLISS